MNGKLLAALERLEREKGISKEILISAIESALISAAYKIIGDPNLDREDITVEMDEETGEITVFKGEEEVRSEQFGRIAAQTAKQVMMQKIREAERDVVYGRYYDRVGEIISGSVHRFEKGNMIVELNDAEAVLPRAEQIPKERFRQGQTIRAYVLKVEKKTSSLDIVLSRANPGFVKQLFELEVPEIAQGIVEIKGIAREAGERTKIAVLSKDEKIDPVGACVGMRGGRVKEIVRELSGERIDIVRWSDDLLEYAKAAVSPVELYSVEIDRENGEIRLAVLKDQLALLIGKRGRNIRLASRLLGWELKADAVVEDVDMPVRVVPGIAEEMTSLLEKAGYNNASELVEAGAAVLAKIESIDEDQAMEIIALCEEAFESVIAEQEEAEKESKAEASEEEGQEEETEEEIKEEGQEEETEEEVKEEGQEEKLTEKPEE